MDSLPERLSFIKPVVTSLRLTTTRLILTTGLSVSLILLCTSFSVIGVERFSKLNSSENTVFVKPSPLSGLLQ